MAVRTRTAAVLRAVGDLAPDAAVLLAVLLIALGIGLSPFPYLAPIWVGVALLYAIRIGGST